MRHQSKKKLMKIILSRQIENSGKLECKKFLRDEMGKKNVYTYLEMLNVIMR